MSAQRVERITKRLTGLHLNGKILDDQVGQLRAGEERRTEGRPQQMGRALQDMTADVDSKTEE